MRAPPIIISMLAISFNFNIIFESRQQVLIIKLLTRFIFYITIDRIWIVSMITQTAANLVAFTVNRLNISRWTLLIFKITFCRDWCSDNHNELHVVREITIWIRSYRFLDYFFRNPFDASRQSIQGRWISQLYNKLRIRHFTLPNKNDQPIGLSLTGIYGFVD